MSETSFDLNYRLQPVAGADASSDSKADATSLKSLALACVAQLLVEPAAADSYEQTFLQACSERYGHGSDLRAVLRACLRRPRAEDAPLIGLAGQLHLDAIELLTVALALAVEEDPMAGRAIAWVQNPVGGSRPTLGLLEAALAPIAEQQQSGWIAGSLVSGMAVTSGVLNILNTDSPLPEQAVQVPSALALALGNKNYRWPGTSEMAAESRVGLPPSIRGMAQRHAESLRRQPRDLLVIRSASLREARSVAEAIGEQLQQRPIFANPETTLLQGLGALCLLKQRLPVFEYSLGPSEVRHLPELPGYDGVRLVLLGPDGNVESLSASIMHWEIPVPPRDERRALWQSYLDDAALAAELADDHVHGSGRIRQLARLARREASMNNRETPNRDDVMQASWTTEEGNLGSLVQAVTSRIPDEALVLPKTTRDDLRQLLQRCQTREDLDDNLGITLRARYQIGVRALLVGPSGTGKTLVASWVATRLGLPLYRVDIASVVSKYIGETEKNLAALLAKAEQTEIVLLFDEADSLFGKRTEIKDANDRHANSQTNYLLQRIETYRGIVILTSNSRGRFDSAFTRRLDKVIEFALPAPEERRALWQSHLGDGHELSRKELNRLALGSDLAGGHIRNAVLAAAVQAKSNRRRIVFDDIILGLESEYRKLGRQIPTELKQAEARKSGRGRN